jgi:hypothetical protein
MIDIWIVGRWIDRREHVKIEGVRRISSRPEGNRISISR